MDFKTAVETCFNKYFSIEGRAPRSEYWWFTLFMVVIYVVATLIDAMIGVSLFSMIAVLGFLAPSICVSIRRLHDKDKSGWWFLIYFVPIAGVLYLLYLFATPGTVGDNRFGPDPIA